MIFVNGIKFGYNTKVNRILADTLTTIPNIQCWSADAIGKLLEGLTEDFIQLAIHVRKDKSIPSSTRASYTRFITTSRKQKYYSSNNSLNNLRKFYNFILINEGLSPLRGFGLANKFGDSLKINPEIQSIH